MKKINRNAYADMYGPTTGDKIRLADTELFNFTGLQLERESLSEPGHFEVESQIRAINIS